MECLLGVTTGLNYLRQVMSTLHILSGNCRILNCCAMHVAWLIISVIVDAPMYEGTVVPDDNISTSPFVAVNYFGGSHVRV